MPPPPPAHTAAPGAHRIEWNCSWYDTPSSACATMSTIVRTTSAGCAPLAVSPDSITASVPSNTALATSVISARAGHGLVIIDSSICVAVMTNLPASWHLLTIIFCASATFSGGISIARSPRATMMPSASAKIASKLTIPASDSILQTTCTCGAPAACSARRTARTSSADCTNDAKT